MLSFLAGIGLVVLDIIIGVALLNFLIVLSFMDIWR
jgi:hypothetical protein